MYFRAFIALALFHVAYSDEMRLFPEDFGEPVSFEIRFSDYNLTYEMRRPLKEVCSPERNIKVLVIILSGPQNFERRHAIRGSWMYDKSNPSGYYSFFLIGRSSDEMLDEKIFEEQQKYGDIIRYSAIDRYNMLSLKTHAAFSWQQRFCSDARYLLKTDDDTVVYTKRLDQFVDTEFDVITKTFPKTLFCNVRKRYEPFRDKFNKYFVPVSEYNQPFYPTHCQGCSYLLSRGAISSLLDSTKNVPFMRLEDVLWTGIIAKTAKVRHHNPEVFGFEVPKRCYFDHRPRLSILLERSVSRIPIDYNLLKNTNCDRN